MCSEGWRKNCALDPLRRPRGRVTLGPTVSLLSMRIGPAGRRSGWLEKAAEEREEDFAFVNVDPRFDVLHSDPRFQEVLRKAGLSSRPGGAAFPAAWRLETAARADSQSSPWLRGART